jgi:predicted Fe-S protein YdhL (DUF1289 family)
MTIPLTSVAPERETSTLDVTVPRALATLPVGSPCTNVCRLDIETRTFCVGCHRTRAEIKAWKTLRDDEKTAIIITLLERSSQRSESAV